MWLGGSAMSRSADRSLFFFGFRHWPSADSPPGLYNSWFKTAAESNRKKDVYMVRPALCRLASIISNFQLHQLAVVDKAGANPCVRPQTNVWSVVALHPLRQRFAIRGTWPTSEQWWTAGEDSIMNDTGFGLNEKYQVIVSEELKRNRSNHNNQC